MADARWLATLPVPLRAFGIVVLFLASAPATIAVSSVTYASIKRPALSLGFSLFAGGEGPHRRDGTLRQAPILWLAAAAAAGGVAVLMNET